MSAWTTITLRAAAPLAALALCAALAGCQTPLERAWGLSQGAHVAQSTENPDAGLHDVDARRPDGRSTDAALTRYRDKELEVEVPEPASVINIDAS
jgi:hypothetical protein